MAPKCYLNAAMEFETEESHGKYRKMAKDCLALKVIDGSSTKPLLLKILELSLLKKRGRVGMVRGRCTR